MLKLALETLDRFRYKLPQKPRQVQIEITNRCNLDCHMCPREDLEIELEHMDWDKFVGVVDRLHDKEEITLTGAEMEDGEVFALTLEGLFDTFNLGEATVSEEGFSLLVTIPAEASPGLYSVVAVSEEGETVQVEITVLQAGTSTGDRAADPVVATAEKMDLERTRTTADWVLALGVILAGGLGGFRLAKKEK